MQASQFHHAVSYDIRCYIFSFLPLNELNYARQTCKEAMKLSLERCYRPPRLSCVPFEVLVHLASEKLLEGVICVPCYKRPLFRSQIKFPIAWLNQLARGTWDCREVLLKDFLEKVLMAFPRIQIVVLAANQFHLNQQNQLCMLKTGPTIWKIVANGSTPLSPDSIVFALKSLGCKVTELHLIHSEAPKYVRPIGIDVLKLSVLNAPYSELRFNKVITEKLFLQSNLLHFHSHNKIYERFETNQAFTITPLQTLITSNASDRVI